ncbi:TonB-dependent receptor [Novosphingobium sp. G106]|uniref:TonB-dependent receptor n=1 Tax=Novosphingobium sp. G106 TaxID=2849500 RepID=UPI001C2D090A|nr:TonB-dependent receptor [Novosphingobium sp. G106]MBV1687961.1 TonB-dependent receptor [Novosphingobium sp. G106]
MLAGMIRNRFVLSLSVASSAVAWTVPTYGQSAASPVAERNEGGLEDIVVTARKRVERMQDVPASISALSAGDLAKRFDSDVRDFADSSPNVVIDDTQQGPGGVAAVYIRGIGVADVEKSVDPAVGVVFDDVYIGQSSGSLLKAIDIDRVEVLRGPQGTLFGRNATGGVINIARSRPTYDLTGKARVTYGKFDTWKAEAVASTGLTDNLAVKVSGAYEKSDGYFYNRFYNQPGQRSEFYAVSGALLFEPTTDLHIQVSYDHQKTKQDPPQLLAVNRPTDLFCAAYQQCSPSPGVPTSGDRYVSVSNGRLDKNATFKLDMAIAKATYDLGSDFQIDYILGWLKTNEAINQDFDAGPQTLYHTDRPARWRQTTNELRLTKGGNGPLTFVLGAYLWDSRYTINLKNYIGFAGAPLLTSAQDVTQTNKSWAFYGEADYKLVDGLTLTVGARYTHDKKTSLVNDKPIFIYGTLVEANPVAVIQPSLAGGQIVMTTPVKASWSKFTPRISLRYELNNDAMVYALWSRGYRGGGFNGRPSTIGAATIPYNPETLDNYEVGFKTEFAGGRVRLNGSAFLMKYKDMQQDLDVPAPGTSTGRENRTINASSADFKGVEFDLTAQVTRNLKVNGNLGYLDAKYKKFFGDIFSTGTPVDATFLKIRRAPKWTWSFGATYETEIGDNASAWITGDVHYIGPHEITFLNNPNLRNGGQYLVDASANVRFNKTTVSVFGQNLANEKGWTIGYDVQGVWSYAAPRPRRTYGVAVTQTF